ncbi:TRAP transporter large permease subunit [Thiotrichales bacterium HSG1]|nr:TRAP transporter large permease subunit [Thiotrichales bacterium HSG1]
MKELVSKLLVDVLGEDKAASQDSLYWWMQVFGLVTCTTITIMIVMIAFGGLPTKEIGYITILTLALIANFCFKPRLTAGKSKPISSLDKISLVFLIISTIIVGIYLSDIFNTLEAIDEFIYSLSIFIILVAVYRVEGKNSGLLYFTLVLLIFYIWYYSNNDDVKYIFDTKHGVFSKNGVYGYALETIVDFVYAVIILSAAFQLVKIDKLLNFFALKMTHNRRSGASAGLYAVWASTFYSAINGEAQGNVAKTGEQTIPVMYRAGYRPEFAVSIQASIAGVGQIVLPIMGTIAFAIVVIDPDISYFNIMEAAIVPALLFIVTLGIAVILEAKKSDLRPLDLEYSEKIKQEDSRAIGNSTTQWIQFFILILGFAVFAFMIFYDYSLALSALVSALAVIIVPYLIPHLEEKPDWKQLLKFIVNSGKDGIDIVIYCAVIGILLFVFKQTGLEKFLINSFLHWLPFWFAKFYVLVIFAILPIILGMILPTLVVFFIMVFVTVPVFSSVGIPELHAYLFVFYYSVLAGITPPNGPLIKEAVKVAKKALPSYVNVTEKESFRVSRSLSVILFILPMAWVLHPEIILGTISLHDFTKIFYVIFTIILAILALSVAYFGIFQIRLPTKKRFWLVIAAILIVFPYDIFLIIPYDFTILGSLIAIIILGMNDFNTKENSILRSAFPLVWQVIHPKNVAFSTGLTFTILLLVYTAYFTINGLAIFLEHKATSHWLTDRFHFIFDVTDCDVDTDILQNFLKENGHDSTMVCSKHADVSISKVHPGEIVLQNDIRAVEFKDEYFALLPELKENIQKSFQNGMSDDCIKEFSKTLKSKNFNPKNIRSENCIASFMADTKEAQQRKLYDCVKSSSHSTYTEPLPVVYIGYDLAEILGGVTPGALIHLHEGVFSDTLIDDIILTDLKQHFVVAAVFESRFPDISEKVVILPEGSLAKILEPNNKLVVKVNNLESLEELKELWNLIKEREPEDFTVNISENMIYPKWPYTTDLSITENDYIWDIQENFLAGIKIMSYIVLLLCLLVLLSGINQVMDKNKKLVILMRLSGTKFEVLWMFLLMLSIVGALVPFLFAIPTSMLTNSILTSFFKDMNYGIDSTVLLNTLGISLIVAVTTTLILSWLHLSRSIAEELNNALKNR